MAPALAMLDKVAATTPGLGLRFTEAPAGAGHYRDTGKSMPETTVQLCEEADAILLGACGLPHIRYPDDTEIMPQVELRFIFDLYAGVRPCRLIPGIPSPIVGAAERGIDLVVIRESTEGLFASMGKGVVTDDRGARDAVITPQDLGAAVRVLVPLRAAAQGARRQGPAHLRRQGQRLQGLRLLPQDVRRMRGAPSRRSPTDRLYVDACSALLVQRPWDFDVLVMENMFGDILSDLTAGLIGGMGMAPSADIGDRTPCSSPATAPRPTSWARGWPIPPP